MGGAPGAKRRQERAAARALASATGGPVRVLEDGEFREVQA